MGNKITKKYQVVVMMPDADFLKKKNGEIAVVTEMNEDTAKMRFYLDIPDYIFDKIKDSEERYLTEPKNDNRSFIRNEPFRKRLFSFLGLPDLLKQFEQVCDDAFNLADSDRADTKKYLAIRFRESSTQERCSFNFADAGINIKSEFQFFLCWKDERPQGSFERRLYKSNVKIGGENMNKNREWHYFDVNFIETHFKLVPYTEERHEFLNKVQFRLRDVNKMLSGFLSDLDEDKIEKLMNNNEFLKLNQ